MTKSSILLRRSKKAEEDEIRKVESEKPLECEPSSRMLEKERLHINISNRNGRNQLTSHWQVEGSGSKSEKLHNTNPQYRRETYIGLPQEAETESLQAAPLVRAERKAPAYTVKCGKRYLSRETPQKKYKTKKAQITLQSDEIQVKENG